MKRLDLTGISLAGLVAAALCGGSVRAEVITGSPATSAIIQLQANPSGARGAIGATQIAPLRNRLTYGGGPANSGSNGGSTAWTSMWTIPVPDNAYAIRMIVNNSVNGSWTLTKAIFTPGTFNDGYNPSGTVNWQPFTWSLAGAFNDQVVFSSTTYNFTYPAHSATDPITGATNIPDLYASDWAPLSAPLWVSTPGNSKYLFIRSLYPANSTYTKGAQLNGATFPSPNATGMAQWAGARANEDHVTTPNAIGVTAAGDGGQWINAIQMMARTPGLQLQLGGDSHFDGTGGGLPLCAQVMAAMHAATKPVYCYNSAWGGQTSATFVQRYVNDMAWVKPSVCLIPAWTANDGISQSGVSQYMARAYYVAQKCRDQDGVPVFITPYCRDSSTFSGADAFFLPIWTALRTEIMASATGALVFDATSLVCNKPGGVYDGTWASGNSTDNIHPNQVATSLIATALAAFLAGAVQ